MLVAIGLLLIVLILICWSFSYSNKNFPPGPIRWPIVGSVPQMLMQDMHYPYRQLFGLSRQYGNLMSIGFGSQFAVVISSIELMMEVLKRPETNMERHKFQFTQQRTNGKNLGIIWSSGDEWNNARRFTLKKLRDFGFGKLRSMDRTMKEEATSLLDDMKSDTESRKGVWRVDFNRLSVFPLNILWSSVGGYRFDPQSPYIKTHIDLNTDIFKKILCTTNVLSVFPFLKIFSKMSGFEEHGKIHGRCKQFMKALLEDAKLKRGNRTEPESVVEVFLDIIGKNESKQENGITEEQLEWILADLFLAGANTTSTVMHWILLYLTLNPSVQSKARKELKKVSLAGQKEIQLSDMIATPYIRAIVLESMRHSPFGVVPPARCATTDILVGDYVIPKGACIFSNLYPVFHDPTFWKDPENFRPERFFDDASLSLDPVKVERVAAQFGFGKRIYPGETMAMNSLFIFVVSLLSRFSLNVVDGSVPTTDPGAPGITIGPQPFVVRIKDLV